MKLFFFVLFGLEYLLRIYSYPVKKNYILSIYGLVDLIAFLPFLIEFIFPGFKFLTFIRLIRVLRVFRILKLVRYVQEIEVLGRAIKSSLPKLLIFVTVVSVVVIITGSMMYVIEGPESDFTSIPISIYWAIVTVTTVGFGDITPQTLTGKTLASLLMLVGYAIIAVPTGIFTYELSKNHDDNGSRICSKCNHPERMVDSRFCRLCGNKFE